jgi:hypothetical protein
VGVGAAFMGQVVFIQYSMFVCIRVPPAGQK